MSEIMKRDVTDVLKLAFIIGILGGVAAALLGTAMNSLLGALPFGGVVQGLVLLFLLAFLAKETKFDSATIFEVVLFAVAIGLVGTVVTAFFPTLAPYILTFGATFSLTGLGFTLVYIMLGEWLGNKLGLI